jgi:hypothetical protein
MAGKASKISGSAFTAQKKGPVKLPALLEQPE